MKTNLYFLIFVIFYLLTVSGCAVSATREGDTMTLTGFGITFAEWPEGYKIGKTEPIRIPEIIVPGI